MIDVKSEFFVYLRALFWVMLFFSFYYPLPNFLKILDFKKKVKYWNAWLDRGLSHQKYLEKYSQNSESLSCYFCKNDKHGHQLQQVLPKSVTFGLIENTINSKNIHYLSHYCSKCGSELYRHCHEV
jgi:hypothetical protein